METTIQISIDSKLKETVDSLFASSGLDIATGLRMILEKIADEGNIPFNVSEETDYSVKLGGWEGKIWMSDDFNAPMEEFEEYM